MNKLKLPVTNPMMGIGTIIEDNGKSVVVRFEGNDKNTLVEKELLYVGSDYEFELLNSGELEFKYIQDKLEDGADEDDVDVDSNDYHQFAAEQKNDLQDELGIQDNIENQIQDRVDMFTVEYGDRIGSNIEKVDGGYKYTTTIDGKDYIIMIESTGAEYNIIDVFKDAKKINKAKINLFSRAFENNWMKSEGTYKDILKAM